MQATERLYLTRDGKKLVREGDPKGATLYAAAGDEIPESAVKMFGLVGGTVKAAKEAAGQPDKELKAGSNKAGSNKGGSKRGAKRGAKAAAPSKAEAASGAVIGASGAEPVAPPPADGENTDATANAEAGGAGQTGGSGDGA